MRTFPAGVRTYQGSCHCGAVRFEADIDPGAGTTRCNCRICTKTGWWGCVVKPEAFRLLAGRESLQNLSANPVAERLLCRVCGVTPFGHGDIPELGGEYYSVNVRCLDDIDLSGVPVHYLDGRHDTWDLLAEAVYTDPFVGAGGEGQDKPTSVSEQGPGGASKTSPLGGRSVHGLSSGRF